MLAAAHNAVHPEQGYPQRTVPECLQVFRFTLRFIAL